MARARNVKPALFENEILGTADPLCTLLFIGLWTLADCEGRLEDRPLRIKAQIFPYRNEIEIEKLLEWLRENHFIYRYSQNGLNCIQIINFCKHQNPHKNEKPSELPSFCASNAQNDAQDAQDDAQDAQAQKVAQAQDRVGDAQKYDTEFINKNKLSRNYSIDTEKIGTAPADSLLLIPDSLNLIPDSLSCANAQAQEREQPKPKVKTISFPATFLQFWEAYPKKRSKAQALKAWNNIPDPEALLPKILETIRGFKQSCEWKRDNGRFIPYPATWLNANGWDDEIPDPLAEQQTTLAPNGQPPRMSFAEQEEWRGILDGAEFALNHGGEDGLGAYCQRHKLNAEEIKTCIKTRHGGNSPYRN